MPTTPIWVPGVCAGRSPTRGTLRGPPPTLTARRCGGALDRVGVETQSDTAGIKTTCYVNRLWAKTGYGVAIIQPYEAGSHS